MPGTPTPPRLLTPVASQATSGFITNPMPVAPTGTNAASLDQGFPPITMQEELAGGQPPLGPDMNGLLFLISSHTMAVQCGQPYLFDATLAGAIGGYLAGTILGMADGTGLWLNLTSGNASNPDTGGAGWVPLAAYGVTRIGGLTGGVVALTAAQSRYYVIVLTGALTSNLTLILPQTNQEWLIVNGTSGGFSTTAQTAASGSTGVIIPQGGLPAPVGVYSVGDGNIYPQVSPLSIPISQAPTANSIVERDNTGNVLAVRFNGNAAAVNPTIQNVIVDAGDGFFQKISLSNFNAQANPGVTAPTPNTLVERTSGGAVLATQFNSNEAQTSPTIQNVIVDAGDGFFQKIPLANFVSQLPAQGVSQIRAAQAAMNNGANRVNFASPFANACVSVVLTPNGATATVTITAFDRFGFNANVGVTESYTYIAAGS